ncbi:ATP-binding cassette domain-containing protein [Candidatus Puniceispirillum sp.]|nr:ATP-binding cassette domain-containing protein [Candidatus Puniceispirillum sp.]
MLEVNALEFGFDKPLVTGLSFTVPNGQIKLLNGPSGCGKSTLLALISGTNIAGVTWHGDIKLDGEDIGGIQAHHRAVGLMYQDPLLFPHLTVGENLAFGLVASIRGKYRELAVKGALASADLDGFGDRDPASLSGGQAARVALMRALLAEPKALLMDEAFSSLDPDLRLKFGRFVAAQIKKRQIPALLVSHDLVDQEFATDPILHFLKLGIEIKGFRR